MIDSFLTMLGDSALGSAIAQDATLFPWIEFAHVVAITSVFGLILVVDLRLLGLAGGNYPVTSLSRSLVPVTWVAFVLAVITGSLLFISNPVNYFGNSFFRAKMILILVAGINMLIFHFWTMRDVASWDSDPKPPLSVRAAGLISIGLWVTIIACGRWIGFTMAPF